MRRLAVWGTLLVGCSFTPPSGGQPGTDGAPSGEDGGRDEGTTGTGPFVRAIDVVDGKVTGGPHTNFPLAIVVTAPYLRSIDSGGDVASAQGFDIGFFADRAVTQRLAYEIESYVPTTGALVAWVKIASLSDATTIYLRYGDPTITESQQDRAAVWSEGFAAVWHLSNTVDSARDAVTSDSATAGAVGLIGDARQFDGNASMSTAGSAAVDNLFVAGGTAEAWMFPNGSGGGDFGRVFDKGTGSNISFGMCDAAVNNALQFGQGFQNSAGNWCSPAGSLPLAKWSHAVVVYDSSSRDNDPILYIDGVARSIVERTTPQNNVRSDMGEPLTIGDRASGGRAFDGLIDEARLSRVMRSADWVKTTFDCENDPSGFVTIGPPTN